jgi:hypothetical protein
MILVTVYCDECDEYEDCEQVLLHGNGDEYRIELPLGWWESASGNHKCPECYNREKSSAKLRLVFGVSVADHT